MSDRIRRAIEADLHSHLHSLSPDQLLAAFLDACRDKDQDMATEVIHELRYRVWAGSPLPRDVRPAPAKPREVRIRPCEDCGRFAADPPSKLCPGCEAYREHTGAA